jgi:tRNA(fMet)-specific endonuclease VapC
MLHMLDTNIVSYLLKNKSENIKKELSLIHPSQICISVMTRAELLYGLKKLPSTHHLQVGVHQLLKLIHVLAWDSDAADFYAEIRHQLTINGQPIGEMDMMIAAHSLAVGAVLITNNIRHFERIALPLTLKNWV